MNDERIVGEIITEQRTLSLITYAPLKVVSAANYLRYGPDGVRRFGPNSREKAAQHPHDIQVHITVKSPGGEKLLEFPAVRLQDRDLDKPFDMEGTNIWLGALAEEHLQISWVWDFFRMFSGVKLDVAVPASEVTPTWARTHETLRDLKPGAQIVMRVDSASGDILQVYPIDDTAFESK